MPKKRPPSVCFGVGGATDNFLTESFLSFHALLHWVLESNKSRHESIERSNWKPLQKEIKNSDDISVMKDIECYAVHISRSTYVCYYEVSKNFRFSERDPGEI